jgi:galactokinase
VTEPTLLLRAPGRVNVIGGHVDHHGGLVVLMAIDRWVEARVSPHAERFAVVSSEGYAGSVRLPIDGAADPATVEPAWGRLVGGVLRAMAERDEPASGFHADVTSTLPIGGGLSSSAAFSLLMALAASGGRVESIATSTLVEVSQRGEHLATGVPCGLADQISIATGGVILLDSRDRAVEPLALPDGAAVVVVESGVSRTLEDSPFAALRAEALATADRLGLASLRDATPADVADDRRARHVVAEIDRVARFAAALRDGDLETAGRLMVASHQSSRDDYGSSTDELDLLVDEWIAAGAYGARLTGGGFGGCVVALVSAADARDAGDRVVTAYQAATGLTATAHVVRSAPGVAGIAY